MQATVIDHVLGRLADLAISSVFGVPGDYSFAVADAICQSDRLKWIGCANELNAAYAADGYARVKGVGALCTTYGVGELSALNGVAGSYAEHLPVFHLVGMPSVSLQRSHAVVHHTLGDGRFDLFQKMAEPVVCASAIMKPETAAMETERLIFEALYHRRPVYMGFPADLAMQPVIGTTEPFKLPTSHEENLEKAAEAIANELALARTACILPGALLARLGAQEKLRAFVDGSGLPFATMPMAKSILDEQHPRYVGIYDGALMNEEVRRFVESRDVIVNAGSLMSDFNTGAFTARLPSDKTISIGHHHVVVRDRRFANVEIDDLLGNLAARLPHRVWDQIAPVALERDGLAMRGPIDAAALYPRWERMLRPDDILVAETGTVSMGLCFAKLPARAQFHNQTLWGSIGWATPAALGVAVAAPGRRVILITGDGAHQLTVQEIGQFARLGLKPIIFVLNNKGYLIERLLAKEPAAPYNDIAQWAYTQLPAAFGCENWLCISVATCEELDDALARAETAQTGVYIEVNTDAYAASPLALKLHDALSSMYAGP